MGSSPATPAIYKYIITFRGVAQLGSATGLGPVGRGFKSCHPDHFRAISSVGQSVRLITGRSGVQVPDGPPISKCCKFAQIAQLVEQRTENPRVLGSIPSLGTIKEAEMLLFLYLYIALFFLTVFIYCGIYIIFYF